MIRSIEKLCSNVQYQPHLSLTFKFPLNEEPLLDQIKGYYQFLQNTQGNKSHQSH